MGRCVNFTLPSFEKVNVDMTETVELGSLKADIRETERTKCLTIPRAKVTCSKSMSSEHIATTHGQNARGGAKPGRVDVTQVNSIKLTSRQVPHLNLSSYLPVHCQRWTLLLTKDVQKICLIFYILLGYCNRSVHTAEKLY